MWRKMQPGARKTVVRDLKRRLERLQKKALEQGSAVSTPEDDGQTVR